MLSPPATYVRHFQIIEYSDSSLAIGWKVGLDL